MAAAGRMSLPKPEHYRQSLRKWQSLSPYMQRKLSIPYEQRAMLPLRPRGTKYDTTLRQFEKEHIERHHLPKGHGDTGLKPDQPRFWQLPPELRDEAQRYENKLKRKWARRIAAKPRFACILHMIAINAFKNPRQFAKVGGNHKRAVMAARAKVRHKKMRELYGDDVTNSLAKAGDIVHLPL